MVVEKGKLLFQDGTVKKISYNSQKLKCDAEKEHWYLLYQEVVKLGLTVEPLENFNGELEYQFYLIQILLDSGILFLQEVNEESPKRHILYLPSDLGALTPLQRQKLISKKNSWLKFLKTNFLDFVQSDDYTQLTKGSFSTISNIYEFMRMLFHEKYKSVLSISDDFTPRKR